MINNNNTLQFVETSLENDDNWDKAISAYPNHTIYHLSSWHKALKSCFNAEIKKFDLMQNDRICGHWCGLVVKKYGMKIYGSPLPGTGTDYMYPLFQVEVPLKEFLDGLKHWARDQKIAHIEIGGDYFKSETLQSHGYSTGQTKTYRIDLSSSEEEIWQNLKPAMRNKVRKAEKNNILISQDNSDQFAEIYYDMLKAVFSRKGLQPTYNLERVKKVLNNLKVDNRIIPLIATKDTKPLATIILLKDANTFYYWGGASYQEAFKYGANDLIHWHAFRLAKEYELEIYDTCGGGEYKKKFGGELIYIPSGYLSLNLLIAIGRNLIKDLFRLKQRLGGMISRIHKD